MVAKPGPAWSGQRSGQAVIGAAPLTNPGLASELAARGVTAVSLDGLPRTLSRAQQMDALSSQSNVAGYKAALVAAAAFGRFFPMLITAAGTAQARQGARARHRSGRAAGHRHRAHGWARW